MKRAPFLGAALALLLGAAAVGAAEPPRKKAPPTKATKGTKAAATGAFAHREDVQRFADDLHARHGLPLAWVRQQLHEARSLPLVRQLIMPPPAGTAKNWTAYRAIFVEPQRVAAGVSFWRQHRGQLAEAQARWGVPAEIVVGIIGVETYYGRIAGNFRVLDALATLAFDFPPGRKDRSGFFREELESLLVWTHREGIAAGSVKGSFAGAIGLPQFMPSSLLRYALDFDGNGHIDLRNSAADAIGSVAHYLAAFGWIAGQPTHYDVAVPVDAADRAFLLGPDIVPSFTATQFIERGALLPDAARAHDGLLALVELQNGSAAPSYIAGTSNFYTVTRYNWSSYYALAVIELGRTIANTLMAADRK